MRHVVALTLALALSLVAASPLTRADPPTAPTYRLYEGLTACIANPKGEAFTVALDVRDLNFYANGPREVLVKVYDPAGVPVVREVIPDDGCTTAGLQDRIGGWDHELQSYVNAYAKGTVPAVRWSSWSDPGRLNSIVKRSFTWPIKGGQPGTYRVVLAGTPDHFVTLRLTPALAYGVAGHPTWLHGRGDALRQSYVYVPQGTTGLFFAFAEPDYPQTRRVKLAAPDGAVLFDDVAAGGFVAPSGDAWKATTAGFAKGQYDGQVLTLSVGEGASDFLVKLTFVQGGGYADYVGMGSTAVFCPDAATATALQGGTIVVDHQVFWHPFQVRFLAWLKANPPGDDEAQQKLHQELVAVANGFRMLELSDGRGVASWPNWAYAMGYYGCNIFRPSWLLLKRADVPAAVKVLIKEGLLVAGDRLGYATGIEKVNGNAFAQIPVALWYSQAATGDALQRERFEVFWRRWTTEGWGRGAGLSVSGDSQEHFAHDMLYGSYIMDNWRATGNTWVKDGGILGDATDEPRFQQVMDRYYELYSYLHCREVGTPKARGASINASPWSARTNGGPSQRTVPLWDNDQHPWKGAPGPDFTVDVNDGHEWFAARRAGYYALTFHGRLAPEWLSETFQGQVGFGGGMLCQLTVPGKGPVLAATLNEQYGRGMHPSQWANFHLHTLVGERWDGFPVVSGISEHDDARLADHTVTSSGEIRGAHLKVTRRYTFAPDAIECSVQLARSDYARVIYLWGHEGYWSELRLAYEMIPYLPKRLDRRTPTAVLADDDTPLTVEALATKSVRIDRGGFGVVIEFAEPLTVSLGQNSTVLIHLVEPAPKPTPAERVALQYRLVPFGAAAPAAAEQPDAPATPPTAPAPPPPPVEPPKAKP